MSHVSDAIRVTLVTLVTFVTRQLTARSTGCFEDLRRRADGV